MEEHIVLRRVLDGGIVLVMGRHFYDERLLPFVGEMVGVRFDPEDLLSVTIMEYVTTNVICEALEA